MSITISAGLLSQTLGRLDRVIERRVTIPILATVLIKPDSNGGMELVGTDLGRIMSVHVDTDLSGNTMPAVCVSSDRLHRIVGSFDKGADVTLAVTESRQSQALSVACGRSRYTLPTWDTKEFPSDFLTTGDYNQSLHLKGAALVSALRDTANAVSTDETRFYLNGVNFRSLSDGRLQLCSTNGHLLMQSVVDGVADSRIPSCIVPRLALTSIIDIAERNESVDLYFNENRMRIKGGRDVLVVKLIDGTFPDTDRVIPSGNDCTFEVTADELAAAAVRASNVFSDRGKPISIARSGDEILITANSSEGNQAVEYIGANFNNMPPAAGASPHTLFGINPLYTREVMERFGNSSISVRSPDPGSPVRFTAADRPGLLAVIMPMRV